MKTFDSVTRTFRPDDFRVTWKSAAGVPARSWLTTARGDAKMPDPFPSQAFRTT